MQPCLVLFATFMLLNPTVHWLETLNFMHMHICVLWMYTLIILDMTAKQGIILLLSG